MKKALIVVAIIAAVSGVVLWVVSWFRTPEAVATSAARLWPGELGALDSVAARLPPLQANDASMKLMALAGALPENEAVDEFVAREMAGDELTIGEPPPLPEVSTIRDLLLREPIVWPRDGGVGDIGSAETSARRGMTMTVARALVASALTKARAGDPTSWEELHAVWRLALSLDEQPEMMMQTAAFSMARMINAVAWRLPLPAPEWFGELQERDHVGRLLEAFQYQAASYWEDGARLFPTKWLADSVEHDRLIAEELFDTTTCDVNVRANELGVDLSSVWRRAFRFRAELEATANALRVREGMPIEPDSRCSDGAWILEGATLRFSRDIATAPPDRPMPLVLLIER
ncbi:MAG TPA: hypothetical protein VF701_10370 [Thermoanaerobaculia bacterium]